MEETCETVKIKSASAPGGYVVINAEDFDSSKDSLFEPPEEAKAPEGEKPKGKK